MSGLKNVVLKSGVSATDLPTGVEIKVATAPADTPVDTSFQELFNTGVVVTLKGQPHTLTPFLFIQLPVVLAALEPLAAKIDSSLPDLKTLDVAAINKFFGDPENFDQIVALISACSGIKKEDVLQLDMADQISLLTGVFQVNVSFFVQRLLPVIKSVAALAKAVTSQLGTMQFKPS